ncbi:TPA: MFS transporter [Klebsiella michiganensis]|uniref:MFS transporter n=1 Tax=Klebsiella TaxID=570 RepID=UPI00026BB5B7|nr:MULTISPECIES: MFS transporter [Klebsiella]AID90801.1 major facilitator transporter [Klebsiella oxytoca KONIH1]AUV91781.1 MFS transporter [Klebsiella oxytoca]OFU85659.1 MFS transporter [Proteus sp. HMSC10D02]AFN32979.1 Multidrug resistance protein D [Klebsiella michiganensis E718]AIE70975.1 major facilitator transporter [Klebsiella michiganensis]
MLGRAALVLVTALLMFPQIAETIYSPALTDISARFSVSAPQAAQTLSVYFIGFAVGVLLWGGFSDRYGRRPALLAGLGVYALGCLMALWATDFSLLLAARIVTAAGAATGSVVTQTVLRDCYRGRQLAGIFSFIGLALAVSPAVGVYIGGGLTALWGMRGVFSALALLAAALLLGCLALMPETRPQNLRRGPFLHVLRRMVGDTRIALAAILVAAFNVSLFSYYSLAPFLFARFDLDALTFGYSGMALAAGSLLGALLNHRLLRRNVSLGRILAIACILHLAGGVAVYVLRESIWFVAPVALVTLAWAMAIPLVLGSALSAYGDCRGTAGAFFGLFYYVLIGAGLLAAGWGQSLGASLLACAGVSMLAGWRYIIVLNEG